MWWLWNLTAEQKRRALLGSSLLLIAGALYLLTDTKSCCAGDADIPVTGHAPMMKDALYERAKEIVAPAGFINTGGEPVRIADHVGKNVILVDFLTYSCINCVRVQPYLNAWHEKYAEHGLFIVGIHTPEFEFEKDITNVERAMRDMEVRYPIALDNDYGTWRAYQNSYWPRKYLIDIDGYIVYDHIGEGGYEETERKIQELLKERAESLGEESDISADLAAPTGVESVGDGLPRTPEIYFGTWRNAEYLANQKPGTGLQNFVAPETLKPNLLYLDGPWTILQEYAEGEKGSSIKLRFLGKKVFMVASSEAGARMKVLIDGKSAGELRGADVDASDTVRIKEEELYRLIEGDTWGEHTLELIIESGTLDAFTFTFG